MTQQRDIERVLEHWFVDGVNEMPDRVYQSIFDRVERQPQALAPRLLRRLPQMNGSLRWIAAAAAVILIVVVGFAVLGRPTDSGVAASPSASPSPTPSQQPTPSVSPADAPALPPGLYGAWIGETRMVPGNTVPQDRSWFLIANEGQGDGLEYLTGSTGILGADITEPVPGKLLFTTWDDTAGCSPGDAGTYAWSLSPGGSSLTLTPEGDDACAARVAALPGTWTRSACPNEALACLGDLEAGTYRTVYFNPFDPPDQPHVMHDGQMQYTVPAGWANFAEGQGNDVGRYLWLTAPTGGSDTVFLRSDVVPHSQADGCPEAALEGVDRTPSAIADWLVSHPGLDTSTPQPVTIDGYGGLVLDLAMDPGWTRTCPYSDGNPVVPLFTDLDPAVDGFDWGIGRDERMRIYLLDLGDGRLLWADIGAADDASFQALLPQATGIVESLDFNPPTP